MKNCNEDLRALRTDRFAHADFARSFGDRDEHDIHDADPGDEQRDRADERNDHRERAEDAVHPTRKRLFVERLILRGERVVVQRPQLIQNRGFGLLHD